MDKAGLDYKFYTFFKNYLVERKTKYLWNDVDNDLFISQNKSIPHSNMNFFCSYNVIFFPLIRFSLVVEYRKTKVFYFSKSYRVFNPPSLDLTGTGGPILLPKTS